MRANEISLPKPITTLRIDVPENATVYLGDADKMKTKGETRVFSTDKIEQGNSWEDYPVVVTITRNGHTIASQQIVTLRSGESHELTFVFDEGAATASRDVFVE